MGPKIKTDYLDDMCKNPHKDTAPTDFNDLEKLRGLKEVRQQIQVQEKNKVLDL